MAAIDPMDVPENSDLDSEMAAQERRPAIGIAPAAEPTTPGFGLPESRL